jgi:Fe2+ transport system protein FeoA
MPLTIIQTGRRVKLVSIDSGEGLSGRLASLGLVPGAEVEVMSNLSHGPVILMVGESRVMLGRGMAEKIRVA